MQINDLFNPALLNKYNINGPRYTSYPTALEFSEQIEPDLLSCAYQSSSAKALSVYIHIPFCHSLCYYCGCNKVVTRHQNKADEYLDYLEQEVVMRAQVMTAKPLQQIHLGGGTPSFLDLAQMQRLITLMHTHFSVAQTAEISIEVDPRRIDTSYIEGLAELGFNRISFGVQDINERVQQAINRIQSTTHIAELVDCAKRVGFKSVNLDLIYGLPHQTSETFADTIDAAIAMQPARVSLFSYAHLPSRFAAQRKIKDEWLPDAATKTALMRLAMEKFVAAGYELIGMDHFAKPDDELAIAQREGALHRNFQGYTTQGDLDLLGLGVSSISSIGNAYGQNPKQLKEYYAALDAQSSLTEKGCQLSSDDMIRRYTIQQLMCNLKLHFQDLDARFKIDSKTYFANEIQRLAPFVDDQIMHVDEHGIMVFEHARLLIRLICMQFDAYLKRDVARPQYSKVI